MKNKKIIAVIVTYNRKDLLIECINACLNQTTKLDGIIIINNASTDGTLEALTKNNITNNKIIQITSCIKNEGCSAGFNRGIKEASNNNADFIWVMDDDTIPEDNALTMLVNANNKINEVSKESIGFLCSQVNWIDKEPHEMNTPKIKQIVNGSPFSIFSDYNCFLVESCSFVSVLISNEAVLACGLPIKEFFIWGDDVEYTSRITKNKFMGLYVPSSKVVHKTKKKKERIETCSIEIRQRYFYNARNYTYIFRQGRGFIIFWLARFSADIASSMKRDNGKIKFLYTITKGYISGLFFRPKIEF